MIEIRIPGKPVAKARPRFYRKGKFVGTYNCQQTEEGRFLLQCSGQIQCRPLEGPLCLTALFYLPRPKNHYGTGRNADKLKPSAPDWPAKRPDLDNYIKMAMDCLNGIAWVDDCQVVLVSGAKLWSQDKVGHTRIIIQNSVISGDHPFIDRMV